MLDVAPDSKSGLHLDSKGSRIICLHIYIFMCVVFFFNEFSCGRSMVAYTKPQQRKKEESGRLRGERDQIKFIDLRFERWQVVRFRKARRKQEIP